MKPRVVPLHLVIHFLLVAAIFTYGHDSHQQYSARELELTAQDVEKELIYAFEKDGEIKTREEMIKTVGPFADPPLLQHMNYTTMTDYIENLCAQYPNLTKMYSIGRSVQGRELWALVVSKYPEKHQIGVPEFKYVANMHGNEVTGRVFLVALAWTLLNNYDTNYWMRQLVDNTRIHLLFSMNPDGYEIAIEGDDSGIRGRGNAHMRDLNRNFPSRYPNFFPSSPMEPETNAVMNWSKRIPFILSANLHGGTTLVNYPYDDYPTRHRERKYSPSPDNDLFVRLAYSYARTHERMWKKGPRCILEEHNIATDPQHGIINGADWYIVPGGMQDWIYLNTLAFEVTVEISCVKYPETRHLKWLWNENKYSILHFIELVHHAIHGKIVDEQTGEGIVNATIGMDTGKIVISYGDGEFWRLANLGTYEVTFDHPDYIPTTKKISVTRQRRSPEVTVALRRIKPLSTTTREPDEVTRRPTLSPREIPSKDPKNKYSASSQATFLSYYHLFTLSIFSLILLR